MSTYTAIHHTEMAEFMTALGFSIIPLPDTKEIVWAKIIAKDVSLRVYSSIPRHQRVARGVGADAIRCLVMRRYHSDGVVAIRPIMKRAKRVYRVEGWKVNLRKAITALTEKYGPPLNMAKSA